jgi:hypothetical protein
MEREKEKNRHQMKRNGICLPIRPDALSDVEAFSRVHSTGYHRQ